MANGILIFAEHRAGAFGKITFEAIAAGQQLGTALGQTVAAVTLGTDAALAQEIAGYKLDKVVSVENAQLADYTPDSYADALEQAVKSLAPHIVVMPHTY